MQLANALRVMSALMSVKCGSDAVSAPLSHRRLKISFRATDLQCPRLRASIAMHSQSPIATLKKLHARGKGFIGLFPKDEISKIVRRVIAERCAISLGDLTKYIVVMS
jgi:hypothetical protein